MPKPKMWRDMTETERMHEDWNQRGQPVLVWDSSNQGTFKKREHKQKVNISSMVEWDAEAGCYVEKENK